MVRNAKKANGESQLGSLPLFLSLFLLLLAFFIFLNSISTRQFGKSDEVIDAVRSHFASLFEGGIGPGVQEGAPNLDLETGLRDRLRQAFDSILAEKMVGSDPSGNPVYVDLAVRDLFQADGIRPQAWVERFFGRLAQIVGDPAQPIPLEVQVWFGFAADGTADPADRTRAGRLAEALLASGVPKERLGIGFRQLDAVGSARVAVYFLGPAGARGGRG